MVGAGRPPLLLPVWSTVLESHEWLEAGYLKLARSCVAGKEHLGGCEGGDRVSRVTGSCRKGEYEN